jgi:GNAT superfamily N-acetyltransferase
METYRIVASESPEWSLVGGGLHAYNVQQAGDPDSRTISYILCGPDEEAVGGLIGEVHWGWFYINLVWLREDVRGRGYGHRMLALAEEEARRHGARHAYLDTFSFQAPDFYRRHGYDVFGVLADFPPGHQRLYMVKDLPPD